MLDYDIKPMKNVGFMKGLILSWRLLFKDTFNLTNKPHLNAYSNLFNITVVQAKPRWQIAFCIASDIK